MKNIHKETIPVFFAANDNYVHCLAVAISSLIENASREYQYRIFIMNDGFRSEHYVNLKSFEREGFEIVFVDMHEELSRIVENEYNLLRCDYITLTIYFRLFIAVMFPEYKKGIYLDGDLVVLGDISKLYEHDLHDNLFGACKDESIKGVKPFQDYIDTVVGVEPADYINSGVLLLNMEKLREVDIAGKFIYLINKYSFSSVAPDQDYLNALAFGKIEFIENSWNVYPGMSSPMAANPMIVHYNLFAKPWHYKGIPFESHFWDYSKKTPYYKESLSILENFSERQRSQDNDNLNHMFERAAAISKEPVTFRAVFNTGKESRL